MEIEDRNFSTPEVLKGGLSYLWFTRPMFFKLLKLMYVFSIFTSLSMYFVGVYVFSSKRTHLLIVLLRLEYIVLSLFLLIIIFLVEFDYDYFFSVVFLVFSVCEGALGLSVLVSIIRSHGNDFFNSFVLSLC